MSKSRGGKKGEDIYRDTCSWLNVELEVLPTLRAWLKMPACALWPTLSLLRSLAGVQMFKLTLWSHAHIYAYILL